MWAIFRMTEPRDEASAAVERAFTAQERQSQRLSMHGRTWALSAVAVALVLAMPHGPTLYYVGGIGAFVALAVWQGSLARRPTHKA